MYKNKSCLLDILLFALLAYPFYRYRWFQLVDKQKNTNEQINQQHCCWCIYFFLKVLYLYHTNLKAFSVKDKFISWKCIKEHFLFTKLGEWKYILLYMILYNLECIPWNSWGNWTKVENFVPNFPILPLIRMCELFEDCIYFWTLEIISFLASSKICTGFGLKRFRLSVFMVECTFIWCRLISEYPFV